MSNRVFKNYQVNIGTPFQVRLPMNLHNIKTVNLPEFVREDEGEKPEELAGQILAKAKEDADLMLREAQLEALRIMEKAEREAEEKKRLVLENAEKSGYEQGVKVGQNQYEQLIAEAEEIRQSARVECNEVLASIEADAVDVILEIAKTVVGREIHQQSDSILYIVKQGFEKCSNNEGSVIRLSSEDYEYLLENREELSELSGGIDDFVIKRDSTQEKGGCVIETSFGNVDAGVHTKLRKIGEAFRNTAV